MGGKRSVYRPSHIARAIVARDLRGASYAGALLVAVAVVIGVSRGGQRLRTDLYRVLRRFRRFSGLTWTCRTLPV